MLGLMKNTPTILQTVYGLDSNTKKDKESFIKIINKMTEREGDDGGEHHHQLRQRVRQQER